EQRLARTAYARGPCRRRKIRNGLRARIDGFAECPARDAHAVAHCNVIRPVANALRLLFGPEDARAPKAPDLPRPDRPRVRHGFLQTPHLRRIADRNRPDEATLLDCNLAVAIL